MDVEEIRNRPETVWVSKLDNRFVCVVTDDGEEGNYRGTLTITDEQGEHTFKPMEVGLSYGAVFGPDVMDVAEWQDMCTEAVDEVVGK